MLHSSSFSTINAFDLAICVLCLPVCFCLLVIQIMVLLSILLVSHRCVTLIIELAVGDAKALDEPPDIMIGPIDNGRNSFEGGVSFVDITVSNLLQFGWMMGNVPQPGSSFLEPITIHWRGWILLKLVSSFWYFFDSNLMMLIFKTVSQKAYWTKCTS